MFSRFVVQTLISKENKLNCEFQIDGTNLIVKSTQDFDNVDASLQAMKDNNINTFTYDVQYSFPTFIGIKMVEHIVISKQTSILKYALYHSSHIKTLTLNALTTIEPYSFAYSTIETINGIENLNSIQESAFEWCTRLNLEGKIKYCVYNCFRFTKIKNIQVSRIGGGAFADMHELETVTIVDYDIIPEFAFYNCFKLKSITFTQPITVIGNNAFENSAIKTFDFSNIIAIESYAFRNSKLETAILPNLKLYPEAFAECKYLTSVTISDKVTFVSMIGIYSPIEHFRDCYALTTVNYGNTGTVSKGMFKFCYSLKTFSSSNNSLEIQDEAFYSCTSLTDISATQVGRIGSKAFILCNSLTSFTPQFSTLGDKAFYGCEKLGTIDAHDCGKYSFAFCPSIKSCILRSTLHTGVMMNCTSLESAELVNVRAIPDKCFFGCTKLKTITFPTTVTVESIGNYAFQDTILELETLDLSGCNQIGNYSFRDVKIKNLKLGNNYQTFTRPQYEIGQGPFADVKSIEHITIAANSEAFKAVDYKDSPDVTFTFETPSIYTEDDNLITKDNEIYYFKPSSSLDHFEFTSTHANIHYYAFSNAKNLNKVTARKSLSSSPFAFARCKSLKTAYISMEGIESQRILKDNDEQPIVPTGLFANCTNLESVTIGHGYTVISESVFEGCSKLMSVIIIDEGVSLGAFCFANCTSLTDIKFNSINRVDAYCIAGCTNLTTLNFTNIESAAEAAFAFSSLENIVVPDHFLVNFSFSYCRNLKKVQIVKGGHYDYASINRGCFNCSSLEEINLSDNIQSIGEYAFGFTKLKYLYLPNNVSEINSTAFYGSDDIQLDLDECSHLYFTLGNYELIERATYKLVLTFGKLPSTYIVPQQIKVIGSNSILSRPIFNEQTSKVVDFGLTTLVIRGNVEIESNPVFQDLYLHNLCYGGNMKPFDFDVPNVKRIFVTERYIKRKWGFDQSVIFDDCDTSVPFENYANNRQNRNRIFKSRF